MKIGEDDKVLSSTEHNHAPEPEDKKARQITTSDSHAGKWMLVEPRQTISKKDEILYTPYLNIAKGSTKDVAVQTDPKDLFWKSPGLPNSAKVWKYPASKDVPVRITAGNRRRLNKEYNWSRY